MKLLLSFEDMGLTMTAFCTFESVHGKNGAPHQKGAACTKPTGREWEKGLSLPHLLAELQRKWEFLEAVRFNTSVSLAAVPAFHDSAFHHLKHVIAFDDNKRIVARELSTVSENTEPPAPQVRLTSADMVLDRRVFGPRGVPKGASLSGHVFQSEDLWVELRPPGKGTMET